MRFKGTIVMCWGIMAVIGLWAHDAATASSNLIKNPSFAQRSGSGIARHWKDNSGWADLDVSYQQRQTPDGANVQIIECRRFHGGAVQFVQPGVAIRQDRTYRITIRMKGNVASPVEVMLRKRGKPYTNYAAAAFKVAADWQIFSFNANVSHDDTSAYFMIRFTDQGRLFIDKTELVDISDMLSAQRPEDDNLIPNSGFEVGIDRWGVQIRDAVSLADAMRINYTAAKPALVLNASAEGRAHLRVEVPADAILTLTSPYVETLPGHRYTVSCWVAADRPTKVSLGLGSGDFATRKIFERTFPISQKWQHLSFSQTLPPAPENRHYFFLKAKGLNAINIDGVRLRAGEQHDPTEIKPAEIGFRKIDQKVIFYKGADIALAARVINRTPQKIRVKIKAYDFWERETVLLTREVNKGLEEITIPFPAEKLGYFRVRGEASSNGTRLDASEVSLGIVNPPRSNDTLNSPFGAHVRFSPEMLAYAKMLGVKWLRMHPPHGTKWFVVEKHQGRFQFYDPPILAAHQMGFRILGLLSESPRWASSAPVNKTSERVGAFRSYPPKSIENWRRYVRATVAHYAGVIDHWEVWNEPDTNFFKVAGPGHGYRSRPQAYTRLLSVAHATAKDVNPRAKIIGGCASHPPPVDWIREIFREGAYQHMDVLSFHRYTDGRSGDALPAPTGVYVNDMVNTLQRYAPDTEMTIWESESGLMHPRSSYGNIAEVSHKYSLPGRDGPAYLVRNYVHLLASGVSKWFYYHMFVSHRIDRREGCGFFEWDGSPRPLAIAYSVLASVIEGARYDGRLKLPAGIAGERFQYGNQLISIVWKKSGQTSEEVAIPVAQSAHIELINIMGNHITPRKHKDRIVVNVDHNPIYIIERLS